MFTDKEKLLHDLNGNIVRLGSIFNILNKIENSKDQEISKNEMNQMLEDAEQTAILLNNDIKTFISINMNN
ncbi:MAG: hypothetical protein ISR65_17545 [Bacteriovoracaceae bacterium]|nr:hypothetical protein [Bacteriovoracaceae bacterium]